MTDEPQPPGSTRRSLPDGDDILIREEPLTIQVGEQQVLTMRTPGDDFALAVGFLLSEGVITSPSQVGEQKFLTGDAAELRADTIAINLSGEAKNRVHGRLTRTHEIRSSCGICGLTDPDELLEDTRPIRPGKPKITRVGVQELRRLFQTLQPLFSTTGACHGAALFSPDGEVWGAGEDVGRHNALDKAIGRAALAGHDPASAIAMISGRAGYDLVFKCLRVGVPVILSVSAASALSHDLCQAAGATLIGFLRETGMKVYCDAGRMS